jgi:glycolate oxidase
VTAAAGLGPTLLAALVDAVGAAHVLTGDAVAGHDRDEALGVTPQPPAAVVRPASTAEVSAVLRAATAHRTPVTPRGGGTGLSGAAVPVPGGLVVSFERMDAVLEVDTDNHVAVVQPGVTLARLDEALAPHGLVYPVQPGENGASLGGNVATNAGGMRAVRYGVTRQQVLGLEVVLATGEVLRTGGKVAKTSTGYDLTQLLVGSEGTLALVTEATLRLHPRLAHQSTVLAPFRSVDEVAAAVPRVVASGIGPLVLEYIDTVTMAAMVRAQDLSLGVPEQVRDTCQAYLLVMLENAHPDRLEADVEALASQLSELGAVDAYVLPGPAARRLVEAREKAFWTAKAIGADDIVDVVVPRAAIPAFLRRAAEIAAAHSSFVAGCGHAGDGNVHLSVFQPDPGARSALLHDLFAAGVALGGLVSGEHGVGRTKKAYFHALTDPVAVALMQRIKAAFDPAGILNPGVLLDLPQPDPAEPEGARP